MTTTDFLEKIVYLREINKNVFIYPTFDKIPLENGKYKRQYTGLWPLNPIEADFLEDETGALFIKFIFHKGIMLFYLIKILFIGEKTLELMIS